MLPPLPKKKARDPSGGKINDFPKAYRQCILASFIFIVIIVINNHQKPIYSIKKSSGIHVQREFYTSDVVGKTANVDNGPLLSELASLQKVNSDLRKILHAIDETLSDPSQKEKRGKDMESEAISKKFAPLLKLNRRSISNSSTRSGPIVFCHVGTTIKFGEHVIVAMKQARQWNPEESIFMISSKSTTVGDGSGKLLRDAIKYLGIIHISIESLEPNKYLESFKNVFFVSNNMAVGKNSGNKHFNRFTMERFFHILRFMELYRLEDVFHLENDNLIYFNTAKYAQTAARSCNLKIGMQARELLDAKRPNRQFMIAGTVYIKDANALRVVLEYNLRILKRGKSFLLSKLKHKSVNDMSLMAMYYLDHFSQDTGSDGTMSILPENPDQEFPNERTWSTRHDKIQSCLLEKGNGYIFDNAAISIWNHGTFQNKKPFHAKASKQAWYAYSRLDPRKFELIFEKCNPAVKCKCAILVGKKGNVDGIRLQRSRVASLHVHSKKLKDIYDEACKE